MKKCFVIFICITVIILSGCEIWKRDEEKKSYTYMVGYIDQAGYDENCRLCMQRFKEIVSSDAFRQKIGSPAEVKVLTGDSDGSVEKQLAAVETMISSGVDIILIFGVESYGNAVAVERCNAAGIPVFMVASFASSGKFKTIGFDEYEFGVRQAEYVLSNLQYGGNICYACGVPGRYPTIQREKGFMDTIEQREDITILDCQYANFNKEDAMQLAENWLQVYRGKIDCIVSQDNTMTAAFVEALDNAKLIDDIMIVGNIAVGTWDSDMIKNGEMDYGIFVSFSKLGELCAEVCKNFYCGENIADHTDLELRDITKEKYSKYFD